MAKSYDDLTETEKLADRVWRHIIFSDRFQESKASELREKYIEGIFGKEVAETLKNYYTRN